MTRLGESVARATTLLSADLSSDATVQELLQETGTRRSLDLTDLPAKEQAELIAARTVEVLPGVEKLAERIEERRAAGQGCTSSWASTRRRPMCTSGMRFR